MCDIFAHHCSRLSDTVGHSQRQALTTPRRLLRNS